jgi:hypothetical protein
VPIDKGEHAAHQFVAALVGQVAKRDVAAQVI